MEREFTAPKRKHNEAHQTEGEPIMLDEKYLLLLSELNLYNADVPPELTEKIVKGVGFKSDDKNTYKLISSAADMLMNDITDSINKIHMRRNKATENPEDQKDKQQQKAKKSRHPQIKCFTLHDLLEDLRERGMMIVKPLYHAHSQVITDYMKD
eukprot:TRINITY_DN564_c0_g2_i2.p1 TRINITY_DN564_c0_g2~~TRINITY_DN564_c0_g2_i2.p1  ORF type:complete len:154 (-),score=42.39 TRINITY_DN564_c0_g2_i2:110-571(-)